MSYDFAILIADDPKHYIEAYIQHMSKSTATSSFHGELGVKNLRTSLLDLLFGGSETTSTILNWSLLILIKYPDVQQKVQDELDKVCGRERLPCLSDRPNLHYTDAVIHEILRFTTLAPLAIPHHTHEDIWIANNKYLIPAGSIVFAHIYHITHNPDVFPDPYSFRPERFLDENKKYQKHDHNIVFGTGE